MADQERLAPPDSETPFQRFQRLAKRIVAAPKPPVNQPKPEPPVASR